MSTFGGTMRLTINGLPRTLRGAFHLMPTNSEVDKIDNQDGSVSRTLKPMAFEADVTFEDDGGDWGAVMTMPAGNITILEDQTGRLHMWTRAFFTGRPNIDRGSGEVSGLKIVAPAYQVRG